MLNPPLLSGSIDPQCNVSQIPFSSETIFSQGNCDVLFSGYFSDDLSSNNRSRDQNMIYEDFINGYLNEGMDYIKKAEGRFSVLLIDHKKKTAYLNCSNTSIFATLQKIDDKSILLFSSKIDNLKVTSVFTPEIDEQKVMNYLLNNNPPEGRFSFYKDILRVSSGDILIWQDGKITIASGRDVNSQTDLFGKNISVIKNTIEQTANTPSIILEKSLRRQRGARKLIMVKDLFVKEKLKLYINEDKKTKPGSGDGVTIKRSELISERKDMFIALLSSRFEKNSCWKPMEVMRAFQDVLDGTDEGAEIVVRIILFEMWMQKFSFSGIAGNSNDGNRSKKIFRTNANQNKTVKCKVKDNFYYRFPLKTDVFKKGDNIPAKIGKYVILGLRELGRLEKYKEIKKGRWFIVISEKIVAIAQGRSKFIWDIFPGFYAKLLSKYVTKTSAGIGLGSPWTMQMAIDEVGLPRIIFAAFVAAVTKYMGYRGAFYHIAGPAAAAIDGPTEYSLYPSNVSAKLGPKNPKRVAKEITAYLRNKLPKTKLNAFDGVAIIDANDLGQKVLGNDTEFGSRLIRSIFKDNPMGQGNEQTPITVVFL